LPKLFKLQGASLQGDLVGGVDLTLGWRQADRWAAGDPLAADEFGDGSLEFALEYFRLILNFRTRSSCQATMIPNRRIL
jgi:hypothetical protein